MVFDGMPGSAGRGAWKKNVRSKGLSNGLVAEVKFMCNNQ